LTVYLNIVQIIISVMLIVLVVLQRQGGGLGGLLGGDSSFYRTRRGMERTLNNLTIILAIIFALMSVLSVILQ